MEAQENGVHRLSMHFLNRRIQYGFIEIHVIKWLYMLVMLFQTNIPFILIGSRISNNLEGGFHLPQQAIS